MLQYTPTVFTAPTSAPTAARRVARRPHTPMPFYKDMELVCRSCGATFIFTAGEQEFYADKGFLNEPTKCPKCRARRDTPRQERPRRDDRRSER